MSGTQIRHVVFIIKENHSFDNYFGTFPGANGVKLASSPNPPTKDPDHRHSAWLTRETTAVRAQFVEKDIPAYFSLARQFALCDNYFTDVAGPSTPNHLMLITADSPIIDNPSRTAPPLFALPSLPASLEKKNLTWLNYGGYVFDLIRDLKGRNHRPTEQFSKDAAAGNLPTVSWVYAPHDASEHPPDPGDPAKNALTGNVTHGMQWTVDQVSAVVAGGLWPTTAIFVTWDDWGGWYDHVDPPNLEQWKGNGTHPSYKGTQFRYGPRVGCLVISPYAKSGYISHVLHSHVGLISFCEKLFSLQPLNQRTSKASDMYDCFDFLRQPAPPPKVAGA